MLKLIFSKTNIGHRTENLDRHGHISGDNWSISYVIDGFHHSDYANDLSSNINDVFKRLDVRDMPQLLFLLNQSITKVKSSIGKASVAFALCCNDSMVIVTCGDTRAYLLNRKVRTKDHSQAQHLIDIGRFKGNNHTLHCTLKQLRRSLDKTSNIDDLDKSRYENAEDLILCSDGVWNKVNSDDMFYNVDSKEHASELFNVAMGTGPLDNQTLMYLRV